MEKLYTYLVFCLKMLCLASFFAICFQIVCQKHVSIGLHVKEQFMYFTILQHSNLKIFIKYERNACNSLKILLKVRPSKKPYNAIPIFLPAKTYPTS